VNEPIPTQIGDVLILRTNNRTLSIHAVGPVAKDGQQDFERQRNVKYLGGDIAAMAEARALVEPGRRIFLRNIDTGEWSEISH